MSAGDVSDRQQSELHDSTAGGSAGPTSPALDVLASIAPSPHRFASIRDEPGRATMADQVAFVRNARFATNIARDMAFADALEAEWVAD